LLSDGTSLPLEIELSRVDFDGEPAVRLCVAAKRRDAGTINEQLTDALERDAATGALQRRFFMQQLQQALSQPIKAGIRQLVAIQPDKLETLSAELGPLAIEEFVGQFAGLIAETRQASDLFRPARRRHVPAADGAWHAARRRNVGEPSHPQGRRAGVSCCRQADLLHVQRRHRHDRCPHTGSHSLDQRRVERTGNAEAAGGGRVAIIDTQDEDTRQQAADAIWVRYIRAALMENRFRLMQQPIASLMGEDRGMFDVLVRMVDEQGQEVLPSEFMAAAERNDLMKNIDRWVIGASMTFCASRKVNQLFVRLSKDSVRDKSLLPWLQNQLKATRVDAQRIVFQVSEQVSAEYLADTTELAAGLRRDGFRFALEHFGSGRDPRRLLAHLPMDYIKVDGTLMQGLSVDQDLQQRRARSGRPGEE
jgi:EAL domain-containing protein (putative c-di-GMP-specific phosphodiesterase class I)